LKLQPEYLSGILLVKGSEGMEHSSELGLQQGTHTDSEIRLGFESKSSSHESLTKVKSDLQHPVTSVQTTENIHVATAVPLRWQTVCITASIVIVKRGPKRTPGPPGWPRLQISSRYSTPPPPPPKKSCMNQAKKRNGSGRRPDPDRTLAVSTLDIICTQERQQPLLTGACPQPTSSFTATVFARRERHQLASLRIQLVGGLSHAIFGAFGG